MLKTILIIIIVILLIGAGGIYYLTLTPAPPDTPQEIASKKSLEDLLTSPNETCTFKVSDQNSGTTYAAESNFRVDFDHNDKGEITKSHMISDFTNVFLWFDGKDIGIRVPWPIVLDNSKLDLIASKLLDLGIEVESDCKPWQVDSSKFELPVVDFKDFGPKIPGSIQEDESSPEKKAQCAACNDLEDKAAAQCRQDSDCN